MKPQLGQVMVDHGLITPDQLAHALAVQQRLGRPLGKLLVELGFVSPGAVANALAEQHGGLLKTEFGISAGLHAEPAPAAPAAPAAEDPRLAELQARLDELEGERVALHEHVREVRAFAEAAAASEHAARTRVREVEAALEASRPNLARLERELAEARARIAELEAAPPAAPAPEPEPEPEPERAHLLFVPSPSGYALLEREGPPPASGALLDVGGLHFRVARVGRAPVPGHDLRCAFLLGV